MGPTTRRRLLATALAVLVAAAPSCSIRRMAIRNLGDALAESGATYASDDDPELIRQALPFALKLIEGLLDEAPEHRGLLTAAASGFTQYGYAFVQFEGDRIADESLESATGLRRRARGLYRRARGYALRGLELDHEGLEEALAAGPGRRSAALSALGPGDLELLYWAVSSWGLEISLAKDDPRMLAQLPRLEALLKRGLEIDADWSEGALHELMIAFEGGRSDAMGGSAGRARMHYLKAVELSGGLRASPHVTYAETVSVRNQDRNEFVEILEAALAVDVDSRPQWRLLNLVMQERARWLLSRSDRLFLE